MADYYSPTVIPEVIPNVDMTPLERLLLSHMFEEGAEEDSTYFHSWQGPTDLISVSCATLREALDASRGVGSQVFGYVEERLRDAEGKGDDVELDMSGTSWEFILQDIVRRSSTLRYISVTTAFTCSKMRPDGFGGMALFITDEEIKGCSTVEFLTDCLSKIASGS